jgi:hypothetical protein
MTATLQFYVGAQNWDTVRDGITQAPLAAAGLKQLKDLAFILTAASTWNKTALKATAG